MLSVKLKLACKASLRQLEGEVPTEPFSRVAQQKLHPITLNIFS